MMTRDVNSEETPYPHLFEPYRMAGLTLRNRIVMAGHGTLFTDPNSYSLSERQAHYLADRAKGGVGLIVQGSSMVHPTGMTLPGLNEAWSDRGLTAYTLVTQAVHEYGAAIFGQLSHLGRQGTPFVSQRELWAPSAVPDPVSRVVPHEMTTKEIRELVDSYRAAAARFLQAGFDGLEVYMCHGFLLCEYLSPWSNIRTDEYGGSLENRCRLPLEIIDAVRKEVGVSTPIGIRISADEMLPGGLTPDDAQNIVEYLTGRSTLEYVSVSQGVYVSAEAIVPDMSFPRAPFVAHAARIREVSNGVPVMAVARIVTPEKCEELIADGVADFVCLVRPLIADPEFPNKAATGRRDEIRECISCNVGCRGAPHRGVPIACLVNPAVGFEKDWGVGKLKRTEETKRIVVVGGGPAGLKAAETAAYRGHDVILLESSEHLGGQVLVAAAAMPYRDEFANSTRFLAAQLDRLGVDIRTETAGTSDLIRSLGPTVVVVATGSFPDRPRIPGVNLPFVFDVGDAIRSGVTGQRVVLVDGGEADWKCLTTAERLVADGHHVRLISPVPVGIELDKFSRPPLLRRLRMSGVEFLENRSLVSIESQRVTVRDVWTGDFEVLSEVDAVVLSWYGRANDSIFHSLSDEASYDMHLIGDALAPRRAIDAIWDGFRVGREV